MIKVLLIISLLGLAGCSRPDSAADLTKITIRAPEKGLLNQKGLSMQSALPADRRVCYGVNVSASDIPVSKTSDCHQALSKAAGFVSEGETLTIEVPKGSGRNIELYAYLTDLGAVCPAWDSNFDSNPSRYLNVYKTGAAVNVSLTKEEENVEIILDFPGVDSHVAASANQAKCLASGSGQLRGIMYTDGSLIEVTSASAEPVAFSKAYWESFFENIVGTYTTTGIGSVTTTGDLNISSGVQAAPYLKSFTRKPDGSALYAMDHQGVVYEVGTDGQPATGFTCPFERCTVPPWVQSISAGKGTNLYALDHAGNIYQVTATGMSEVLVTVSPAVSQVSFY